MPCTGHFSAIENNVRRCSLRELTDEPNIDLHVIDQTILANAPPALLRDNLEVCRYV